MRLAGSVLMLISFAFIGCDDQNGGKGTEVTAPVQSTQAAACHADPRFQKVEVYPIGMRVNLALDVCTGNLCRTWNWRTNGGQSPYNQLPTCASLSNSDAQVQPATGVIAGP